tara:strand:+ start:567 stop:1235 length:669 start_codon:yes stop_codon:yes gene_type:complete
MKLKLILSTLAIALASVTYAQTFECIDKSALIEVDLNSYNSAQIDISNLLGSDLFLEWDAFDNTLNPGWDIALCDYTSCYTGIPDSGTMTTLPGGINAFFKINVNPYDALDSGEVSFSVYDAKTMVADTVTFKVVAKNNVGIRSVENDTPIDLYPNPAKDNLNFTNVSKSTKVDIYSVDGQHIASEIISNSNSGFSVAYLNAGVYFAAIKEQSKTIRFTISN